MTIKKPRSGNALFVVIVSENKEDNKAPCSGCALNAFPLNPSFFCIAGEGEIICLVQGVGGDAGCSPCVIVCPPGGGKGKAATGDRCCGGGGSYPCRVGFDWRVYGFLSKVAPINKVFSLVEGL